LKKLIEIAKKVEKLPDLQSKIEAIALILWRNLTEVKQVILTFFSSMFPMQRSHYVS